MSQNADRSVIVTAVILFAILAVVFLPARVSAAESTADQDGNEIVTELGLDDEEPAKGVDDLFANADEAARQTANPMGGDFIVWLNQFNFDFQKGDITGGSRNAYVHILQPVIPFPLKFIGDDWIMVNRPTLPIIYSAELPTGPDLSRPGLAEFESKSGFADIISFHLVGVSKYHWPMFGWFSEARTLASRSKRARRSGFWVNASGSTLSATSRSSFVSLAR